MDEGSGLRRLAAIVSLDIAGYSARARADEDAAAGEIAGLRRRVESACERHGGRLFNTAGDGFMLEFGAVSGALAAAEEIAAGAPPVRVGVHLGEVRVAEDGDLLGHGVNVAARVQALARPGEVLVSDDARRALRGPLASRLHDRGVTRLDKMGESIRLHALETDAAKPSGSRVSRRALAAAGVVAAAGAAGAGGWWAFSRRAPQPATEPTVAVLPFDNLSADPQLGYFADGLAEDILNSLIRGGGMKITARSSSFTFRGAAKARAGQALKADYLLDGSVLRDGARMRVNAQLSRVSDQQTLWSDSYDRDLAQGLQVEDEIAAQVASALRIRVAASGGMGRIDPEAYDLYLKGRAATRIETVESLNRGGDLLRQALGRDPQMATAWYELANNYSRKIFLEPLERQPEIAAAGLDAAARAARLDPRNGAAVGIVSELQSHFGRWAEIEAAIDRGLAISPNDPDLLLWRGDLLMSVGRIRAAAETLTRSHDLDPLDLFPLHTLCLALTYSGQFGLADQATRRLEALGPGTLAAFWDRFWLLAAAGRDEDAIGQLNRPDRPRDLLQEYQVYADALRARTGPASARQAARATLLSLGRRGMGYAGNAMWILARLGFDQDALDVARALYVAQGPFVIDRSVEFIGNSRYPPFGRGDASWLFFPFMDDLRRSGRLTPIFDGVGLTDYWRRSTGPDA